jgi:UDP-2,3-diacylglucosamine hydrolase
MRSRAGRQHTPDRSRFVDVDEAEALRWMRDANAATLVHGHTHAPATHSLGPGAVRHVLSDWHIESSGPARAEVLRWQASGFARIAPETGSPPA